jgi:hypothetical protein
MSLHAQLSQEAAERLHAQKRNSTISSVIISVLVLVLIALVLFLFTIQGFFVNTPTIVTYSAGLEDKDKMEKKEINNQIQRKPSAPSSSMAKVIASTTPTPTAVPVPEVDVPDPSTDFGSGDDFGDGWGSGSGGGGGGFANIPPTMRKRCTKADRLQRLADNGGTPACEDSVVKALRFLQKTQNKDGSWDQGHRVAMTGIVLLAYLGHCETPLSDEFGDTVLNAMNFLISVAEKNKGKLATDLGDKHWCYEHAIATYAVAESYTFCNQLGIDVPGLEKATMNSVQWIINNQNESGGWEYAYDEGGGRGGDLSITAWQLQALKAGHATGIDFKNYRRCVSSAVKYVAECQSSDGSFAYTTGGGGKMSLTGAGALCMQQHKGASNSGARKGVKFIDKNAQFDFTKGPCNLYEHYYSAQAMINAGGKSWKKYNTLFRDNLLAAQQDDGSWANPGGAGGAGASGSAAYRTALCTLMLEVYYRFLPGTGK